jgi:hypothetical protein
MLPHFVWEDLRDVVDELRAFGYPLELGWFAPHLNFRFPLLGDFAAGGVEVELRMALEPWHVLGEESGGRRHGALRRLLGGAGRDQGERARRRAPRDHLQRPARARCSRPARPASSSPACAIAPGTRPRHCIRRSACRCRS